MPLPTAYDANTLAAYMVTVLGTTATALGWTAASGQLVEAVNEVDGLLTTGIAGQTTVASVLKVRALARWQAWKAARSAAANQYNLSSSGDSLTRSQWYDHLDHELYDAALAATAYPEGAGALMSGAVMITSIADTGPYGSVSAPEFG